MTLGVRTRGGRATLEREYESDDRASNCCSTVNAMDPSLLTVDLVASRAERGDDDDIDGSRPGVLSLESERGSGGIVPNASR